MKAFIVDLTNRPGSLATVCEALGAGGVNIGGIAGAAAGSTGSFAFTADDEAGARAVLDGHEWIYREVGLVVAVLEHRPGTLADAARRIANSGVNVETMFAIGMDGAKVMIAFGVSNVAAARAALGELAAS